MYIWYSVASPPPPACKSATAKSGGSTRLGKPPNNPKVLKIDLDTNGHGSDKYPPPPVVVVLWLGCGGLGLV